MRHTDERYIPIRDTDERDRGKIPISVWYQLETRCGVRIAFCGPLGGPEEPGQLRERAAGALQGLQEGNIMQPELTHAIKVDDNFFLGGDRRL